MTERGAVMRVPTPPTGGRRRAGAVAFVASFATLWLVLPPASAGLIAGEIPAPVHVVDATAVPAPPRDGAATGEGNPEEGAAPDRPRAEVLGGFLAGNALVVLTAGVLRHRSAAKHGQRRARRQPRSTRSTHEAELA